VNAIQAIISIIDRASEWFGRSLAWLTCFMVVATFTSVLLRYGFGVVVPALSQSVLWAFGIVLTGCAGYALLHDDHVRVDVFYRPLGARGKALVNMLGSVFLLAPFLYVMWTRTLPYVQRSWAMREGGQELSGLTALYLLKTFLLIFVVVLAFQGVSVLLKSVLVLSGHAEHPARKR
jgi:TRAP-type mannitol/chloroaromatic compound transport system permease small subunit